MAIDLDNDIGDLLKQLDKELKAPVKKCILAVDDDRNVLKLIKNVLGEEYEVTTAANGKMAESFLESRNADLILLDYEMPLMSGAEVLKKIRESITNKNIPVVMLTSVSENDKVMEILSLGIRDYILKPIDVQRLRDDVRKILGSGTK